MVCLSRTGAVILTVLISLSDVLLTLQIPAPATFRLTENGTPCLLASFNASVMVSYEKLDEQNNQTHKENVTFEVPPWSMAEGKCSKSIEEPAVLTLTWNDSITLSLKFKEKSSPPFGRWYLQRITLRYDPSDPRMFPDSVESSDETYLVASNLSFLGAKGNLAYVCPRTESFKLKGMNGDESAYITLSDIELQPFGVTGVHFRKESVCGDSAKKKKIATPKTSLGTTSSLVVASCLALIVLVVVIVYIISRNSAITGYTSM